jgi:retron-type reverse transcriptase
LKARHCTINGNKKTVAAGVPQGDSLSMLLFCMAINPVLEEIQKSYKCISYADDIVIAHSPLIPAK